MNLNTARAPQPPTNRAQMSRQGLYVPEKACFGPNLAFFGKEILFFTGGSKSFGSHITENHLGTLFALFFGQACDQMHQKMTTNAYFWPNLAVLGQNS